MTKLTDDQLGDLLRETFADHSNDTNSLPAATKRRPLTPVLIAAAAVLAVLAGTVYTVRQSDPEPPAATATAATNAEVWATAIRKIAESHKPAGGWRLLRIFPGWTINSNGTASIPVRPRESGPSKITISMQPLEREKIARLLSDLAPVEWGNDGPAGCPQDVAQITIGPIVKEPSRQWVDVSISNGCAGYDHLLVNIN